jgi:LPS export ABC transporter protein LptC
MAISRRTLFITLGVGVVALAIGWQSGRDDEPEQSRLTLPDNAPDLYIEQPQQTQFDASGRLSMSAEAESLAYYEDRGESLMTSPVMTLLSNAGQPWRITSGQAILFNDGSANFERDVEVTELDDPNAMQLFTDWLRVEQNGRFVTTPRPVRLLQPGQVARGVGMDAILTDDDSEITLKSEVSIRYDAN